MKRIALVAHDAKKADMVAWVLANADALGLQSAVFTKDINRAFRFMEELETGQVVVNDSNGWWDINMPFGGAGGKGTGGIGLNVLNIDVLGDQTNSAADGVGGAGGSANGGRG